MTEQPSDTDRIIAAHRVEARKTRVLLVWLLVGIPLAIGAIWGGIVLVGVASRSGSPADFTSTVQTSTPQVLGITDSTTCAAIDAGVTDQAVTDYAGQPTDSVRGAFQNECTDHPDWSAARALTQAKRDFTSPTG